MIEIIYALLISIELAIAAFFVSVVVFFALRIKRRYQSKYRDFEIGS